MYRHTLKALSIFLTIFLIWGVVGTSVASADVALVPGNTTGTSDIDTPARTIFFDHVTAGDVVIFTYAQYSSGDTQGAPTIAQSNGDATIGPITIDKSSATIISGSSFQVGVAHALVTGSGSIFVGLTLGTNGVTAALGMGEFSYSGTFAIDATPVSNTGTGTTESTGSVTAAQAGEAVVMAGTEGSDADFTYTPSDTLDFAETDGSAVLTMIFQHKITSGAGSVTLTADTGHTWSWVTVGVAYKDGTGTPPPPPPPPSYGKLILFHKMILLHGKLTLGF